MLEEWRLYQGFSSRLEDNLLQLLFGSSLYAHRSPIGLPEVIETAPVQLLSTTAADGRLGCWTVLKSQRLATANVSDPNETKLNLRLKVPSLC